LSYQAKIKQIIIRLWVASLVVTVVMGCNGQDGSAPAMEKEQIKGKPLPENQFFDYKLIETDSGIRQWVLKSDEMQKFPGQTDVLLINVTMDFFREGEHFSVLTADSGLANPTTHNVHSWGSVVIVTNDGRKLETEELFFDNKTELIHNDVFDRFTRDGDVITGIGLEATPDLEYIEIKQRFNSDVADEEPTESSSS
jgi:LPS export ABC transporter protein LptC